MSRSKTYFVSDVHLGLNAFDPQGREKRFVNFLCSINTSDTDALYMLGDIWDFWYEWKEVVPKGYVRVLAALTDLIDSGIKVYFFPGNHDIWVYSYFEELGMVKLTQPAFVSVGGLNLCLGHGDGLGKTDFGFRILKGIFHCRILQILFSSVIHPTLAMKFGKAWSKGNRLSRGEKYEWKGKNEPLVAYCEEVLKTRKVDKFIFGHYHVAVREPLSGSSELVVLDSWIESDSVFCIGEEVL